MQCMLYILYSHSQLDCVPRSVIQSQACVLNYSMAFNTASRGQIQHWTQTRQIDLIMCSIEKDSCDKCFTVSSGDWGMHTLLHIIQPLRFACTPQMLPPEESMSGELVRC